MDKVEKYYILDSGNGLKASLAKWLEKNPSIRVLDLSLEFNNKAVLVYYIRRK